MGGWGDAYVINGMDYVMLDAVLEVLEQIVSFFFVHNKRVTLSVGMESDPLTQIFHRREMLEPVHINDT